MLHPCTAFLQLVWALAANRPSLCTAELSASAVGMHSKVRESQGH